MEGAYPDTLINLIRRNQNFVLYLFLQFLYYTTKVRPIFI
jgi:hypothetical protein